MRRTKRFSRLSAMLLSFVLAFMSAPFEVLAEEITEENIIEDISTEEPDTGEISDEYIPYDEEIDVEEISTEEIPTEENYVEEISDEEVYAAPVYSEVLDYGTGSYNDYSGRYHDIDPLFNVPYVSTYYFNPKPHINEDVIIPIYITDSTQSEYLKNDDTITLDVIYEIDGVQTTLQNIPLGDYSLNIGKLSEGRHIVAIQTYDKRSGMKSHKLYNDLWVVDPDKEVITAEQIYYMSEKDLDAYNIKNNDSDNSNDLNSTRDGLTKLFEDVRDAGYRKIVLLGGTYRINGTVDRDKCISIPSYLTVDMNHSTFKLDTVTTELRDANPENPAKENKGIACIVIMNDVTDAHLINGTIEGDRLERQAIGLETTTANKNSVGEQIMAVSIVGGKYCSISNLTIKNTTGYTVGCGAAWGKWEGIYSYTRTAIINGEEVAKANCSTSTYMDLTNFINWNPDEDYMYVGHFLGNRGILGESEIVYISFYDNDKKFMSTVTGYQYRKVLIPAGAKYARITVLGSGFPYSDNPNTLFIYAENMAEYHEITNISFVDTRTCALVPTSCNNLLIENNTYTRCGNSITPIAVDMEDGWEECQDVYYRNNKVLEAAGTGTVVDCAGMNHVYENNIGHNIEIRHRLAGCAIRNTNDPTSCVKWNLGNWKTGFFGRIYNNNIGNVAFYADRINEFTSAAEKVCVDFKVKNCTITNGDNTTTWINAVYNRVEYENCTFTHLAGSGAVFRNCIIQPGNQLKDKLYFYDCTFKAVDGISDGISLNLSIPYDADRLFDNCIFEGKTTLGGYFHSGVFRGCEFEDVAIYTYVNSTKAGVLFENCKLNSTSDVFITNGPYAKMYDYVDFQFKNCEITHSGNTLIYFSAEPTINSKFLFEGCSIINTKEWLTRWETGYWAELNRPYASVDVIFKNTDVDRSLKIDSAVGPTQARVSFESGLESKLMGYTISLTGQIAMNFYIQLPDSIRNNSSAIVHFTLPGGETVDVKASEGIAANNYSNTYIYSCEVPASFMTSSVTVQVQIPSTGKAGTTYRYLVKDYGDYILSHTGEFSTEVVELVKAMLNYGGYAQKYFGVNLLTLANEGLYTASDDPVQKTTQNITANAVSGVMSDKYMTYIGASLICEGNTGVRLYFSINSGMDESRIARLYTVTTTLNGVSRRCNTTVTGGIYMVTLYDVTASELDSYFNFTLKDSATKAVSIQIKYSPINYMAQAQNSSNPDLVNLTRAMYIFNQAAKKVK